MLSYEEFKKSVAELLSEQTDDKYMVEEIVDGKEKREVLLGCSADTGINLKYAELFRCVTGLKLDTMYTDYCRDGGLLDDIVDKALEIMEDRAMEAYSICEEVDDGVTFEDIKDHIYPRLIGKSHKWFLNWAIHVDTPLDFSIVFVMHDDEEGEDVVISEPYAEICGETDPEKYKQAAFENVARDWGIAVMPLGELTMFSNLVRNKVTTCESGMYGASLLLMEQFKVAAEQVLLSRGSKGDVLYIMPSSIHDLIVYPGAPGGEIAEDLFEVVKMANADSDVVSADAVLTNSVYQYDPKTQEITIAYAEEVA